MNNSKREEILTDFQVEAETISSIFLRLQEQKSEKALPRLSGKDFVDPATRTLWKIITKLHRFGEPIDLRNVLTQAETEGLDRRRVQEILFSSPDPFLLDRQIQKLKALTLKRKLRQLQEKLNTGQLSFEYFFRAIRRWEEVSQKLQAPKDLASYIQDLPTERAKEEWTCPGFLPKGLVWLCGSPKVGKSWLALKVCCDLSLGPGPVLDGAFDAQAAIKTLYVLGDTGLQQPAIRIKKTGWRYNSQNLKFVAQSELSKDGLEIDLSTPDGQALLERLLDLYRPDVLVLDSISSLAKLDFNKEVEARGLAFYLNRLAQRHNCTIWVIHHTRKSPKNLQGTQMVQDDVSGSGALIRFATSVIGVELKEKDGKKTHIVRHISGWTAGFEAFGFRLIDDIDEESGEERIILEVDRNPEGRNLKEQVWQVIQHRFAGRRFRKDELLREVSGVSEEWVKCILRELVSKGKLQRFGSTRDTIYFLPLNNTQDYTNQSQIGLNTGFNSCIPIHELLHESSERLHESSQDYTNPIPESNAHSKPIPADSCSRNICYYPNPNPHGKPIPGQFVYSGIHPDEKKMNTQINSEESSPPNDKKPKSSTCRYCGQPIEWGFDPDAQKWIPCEPGYRGEHRCLSRKFNLLAVEAEPG